MGVPYHDILANVALRTNALAGPVPATLQSNFVIRPLTAAQFDSSIFPFASYRDAILAAEQRVVRRAGLSDDKELRAGLIGLTAALTSGAAIPSVNAAGKRIVGRFSAVLDGTDATQVCLPAPMEEIQRRLDTPSLWKLSAYDYAVRGGRIVHTRTTVKLEVVTYDYATQKTTFDANGDMLLPDDWAEALICGALSYLVRDDEFAGQAAGWRKYFDERLAEIPVVEEGGAA